jgi:hypothetical protein
MTNNRFEVLSNLNGSTDYNPIEIQRKFYPTTSSRSNSLYSKASKAKHNDKELPSNKHSSNVWRSNVGPVGVVTARDSAEVSTMEATNINQCHSDAVPIKKCVYLNGANVQYTQSKNKSRNLHVMCNEVSS